LFDVKIYQALPGIRLFIIRDVSFGSVPSIGDTEEWPAGVARLPADILTSPDLLPTIIGFYRDFNMRQQDVAFLIPEDEEPNLEQSFKRMSPELQRSLRLQHALAIRNQHYYVRGFDSMGNFVIPPGYEFLSRECERFFVDHPAYQENVFLMTRFDLANKYSVTLDEEIRRVLRQRGFNPVRADDKVYMPDRNLWNNVCVYMLCCSRGIAILEDRGADEFNPNVAIEYGFMRALNKPTLLLADRAFRNLRADVIGTLRETFDLTDIETTIPPAIERWLRD
jgi:hypothetical protein